MELEVLSVKAGASLPFEKTQGMPHSKKNRSGVAGAVGEKIETLAGCADYIFK
jgi:hypothetical protein